MSSSAVALVRNRISTRFVPTVKGSGIEDGGSKGATTLESVKLLLRAGYIRQSASGFYTLLPNGLRVVEKLERVIDEEMCRIGASKLSMPSLLPTALWHKTGRYEAIGSELFKLRDRRGSDLLLAPTHEEEVTSLVAAEVSSQKQLPVRVYQITRKHRDEPRPRSGLLRAREFIMKDLYTFDSSEDNAGHTYELVSGAYRRIFQRIGVDFAVAEADSGAIGGNLSHEYHYLDPAGEDTLLSCARCRYTANSERALSLPSISSTSHLSSSDVQIHLFSHPTSPTMLTVLVVPRSRELNALKAAKVVGGAEAERIGPAHWDWKGKPEGPLARFDGLKVVLDGEAAGLEYEELEEALVSALLLTSSPSSGPAEQASVNHSSSPSSDTPALSDFFPSLLSSPLALEVADLRTAREGDGCAKEGCGGMLEANRAIEVGHTFYLGTKYSAALGATFAASPVVSPSVDTQAGGRGGQGQGQGQTRLPFQMGCYGLGVSRLLGAVAQKCHDGRGLRWPSTLAPYRACVIPSPPETEAKTRAVEELYGALERGGDGLSSVLPELREPQLTELADMKRLGADAEEAPSCDDVERRPNGGAPLDLRNDVVIDDRHSLSLGHRLKDAELIGYTAVFVLGKHWEKTGEVEVQLRATGEKRFVRLETLLGAGRGCYR